MDSQMQKLLADARSSYGMWYCVEECPGVLSRMVYYVHHYDHSSRLHVVLVPAIDMVVIGPDIADTLLKAYKMLEDKYPSTYSFVTFGPSIDKVEEFEQGEQLDWTSPLYPAARALVDKVGFQEAARLLKEEA